MINKQKSAALIIFIFMMAEIMILLTACVPEKSNLIPDWKECTEWLSYKENYSVSFTTFSDENKECIKSSVLCYGTSFSHITDFDGDETIDIFCERSDDTDTCIVYAYNEEYDYWVGAAADKEDIYFSATPLIERMTKIGAWFDTGQLKYDADGNYFYAEDLPGAYVFDGQAHCIRSIKAEINDGKIVSIQEKYSCGMESDSPVYYDELIFYDIGITHVSLPENSIRL